jgi:hypothetical protein
VTEEASSTSLPHVLQQLRGHGSCTRYALHMDSCCSGRGAVDGPDTICGGWTTQQHNRCSGIREARHLLQRCPSYDAIAGRHPASSSVSKFSCIDFRIVIEDMHWRGPGKCSIQSQVIRLMGGGSSFTSSADGPLRMVQVSSLFYDRA